MPSKNQPSFSSKPLGDEEKEEQQDINKKEDVLTNPKKKKTKIIAKPKTKKKLVRKKSTTSTNNKIGSNQLEMPIYSEPMSEPIKEKKEVEIDEQLNSIYQDNQGHIPNMRRIKIKKNHPVIRFFFYLIVISGLLAATAWTGLFFYPQGNKFSEEKVLLDIKGPQEISLGATTTYYIYYENNQSYNLKNAVLTIQYPKGFIFTSSEPKATNSGSTEWDLKEIQAQEKNHITITGKTYGAIGNPESWRVFLTYQPEKFNYKAQKVDTLTVELKSVPLEISLFGPEQAKLGSDIEYSVKISNKEKQQVGLIDVVPSWSANFFITTSTPAMNKYSEWSIDTNTNTYEWELKLKGRYASTTEQKSEFKTALATRTTEEETQAYEIIYNTINTDLVQDNLNLSLAINGATKKLDSQPGQTLNFTIYLKNSSRNDLKNTKVKLIIDSPSYNNRSILDWPQINDKYDGNIAGNQIDSVTRRGQITWDKNFVPDLSNLISNDIINIDVSIPIRDINKFDLSQLETHEIKVSSEASYEDQNGNTKTLSSNPINIVVNSDLALEIRDSKSTDQGKEQHRVNWILTNNFHTLDNLTVTADVYGKTSWQLNGIVPAGKVDYDKNKQKITWTIEQMPESVDVLALPFTITIEEPNPTQDTLISEVQVQAEDSVTKEKIKLIGQEIKLK
ncbi:MAG: hypothetical protein ABIH87_04565 [bacterium]